ncbi:hypothetical protein [Acinetobacter silvestris]|uniref:Internalin n=1 Tax=Acinetobacter silvestris TaxID=1977882 RepID=A0A1Y3CH65_9GAMM|nr:hypothetical protein [Acinetobacter silvestris]OTG65242.1 hypothetical protein B9T28_10090 [Acinetobacter silvestris]
MNFKLIFAALIITPLALTACSKQEKAPASEQTTMSEPTVVTPEQQAAIDAIDKPVLDEKNIDISAEKANVATDVATPATEVEASKAQ